MCNKEKTLLIKAYSEQTQLLNYQRRWKAIFHMSKKLRYDMEDIKMSKSNFFLKKYMLLIMLLQLSPFPPFTPLHPAHPLPPTFPPYSSCPWVILISSLASTFPTLFVPSPCLFSTYHLCYLFSVPFPLSPPPNTLLITLHVISISGVLFLF